MPPASLHRGGALAAALAACLAHPASAALPLSAERAGVAAMAVGSELDRYDLAAHTWLPTLWLSSGARALVVDDDALYVLYFGGRIARVDPDTGSETLLADTGQFFEGFAGGGGFLFASSSGGLFVYDAQTGALVDQQPYPPGYADLVVDEQRSRLLARNYGWDLVAIPFDAAGVLGEPVVAPDQDLLGELPRGWLLPDASRYVDAAGYVYRADDLACADGIGPLDAFASDGQHSVLRAGEELVLLGADFAELGRYPAEPGLVALAVRAGEAVALYYPPRAVRLPWSAFAPREPSQPPPFSLARGLALRGGIAWFADSQGRALQRWSLAERRWLDALPLRSESFADAVLDAGSGRLLLQYAYSGGGFELAWRALDSPSSESAAGFQGGWPCGIAALWPLTSVCIPAWPQRLLRVLGPDGGVRHELPVGYDGRPLLWDGVRRRLYFAASDTSPGRLRFLELAADGSAGEPQETGLSRVDVDLSPDAARLRVGDTVYDAASFEPLGSVPPGRFAWLESGAVVVNGDWRGAQLTWLAADLSVLAVASLAGQGTFVSDLHQVAVVVPAAGPPGVAVRIASLQDFDGDEVANGDDAYPLDGSEWSDRDGDGVGDNGDAFPDDPAETADRDHDGVGDGADAFPNDPSESSDRDGDGWGDNRDALPDDPLEQYDSDGDGVGDHADWRPWDPSEQYDSDGDGVGDNADELPFDPSDVRDTDGDGVGDRTDRTPLGDPALRLALNGTQRLKIFGAGYLEAPLRADLDLVGTAWFTLCDEGGCVPGLQRPGRRGGLELAFPKEVLDALDAQFEDALEQALREELHRYLTVSLSFRPAEKHITVRRDRRGEYDVRLRIPYELVIEAGLPRSHYAGAWTWRVRHPKPVALP